PLQAVELDPHGQGFQPLSRDRFEARIEGRLFHAGLFPPLPEALSSALASAVSRPVACAAAVCFVRVPHWTAPYRADATTQKYRDFPAVDGAGRQVAGIDYTHADVDAWEGDPVSEVPAGIGRRARPGRGAPLRSGGGARPQGPLRERGDPDPSSRTPGLFGLSVQRRRPG